jgi:hypothetical protein
MDVTWMSRATGPGACVAVCSDMLQCAATCCSVQRHVAVCSDMLQCAATCCSVQRHVAVCSDMLQCAVTCCSVQRALLLGGCAVMPCHCVQR